MKDLAALLARWHELEPDRCTKLPPTGLDDGYTVTFGDTHWNQWPAARSALQDAVLLAAVIEAATTRGWEAALTTGPGGVIATITRPPSEHDRVHAAVSTTDPPATTLLRAYLKALEAEAAA